MTQYRKEKIDSFRFIKDKKLSLGVEILFRNALSELGEDRRDIIVTDSGKPHLRGSDIEFNLSHSESRVMCCVSDRIVGCDVEKIEPIDLEIAKRYFFGSEYETIMSVDDDQRNDVFYRFWTLKESFIKAIGLGMSVPLDSFRITLGDDIGVEQSFDSNVYHFKEYLLNDGYRYACCSLNEQFSPIERVELSDII